MTVITRSLISESDLADASRTLDGVAVRTPLLPAPFLGDDVYIKPEMLQRGGAFKLRGAYNLIAQLSPAERAAGVVTYSSGNHGQAVARSAQLLRIRAVVVMPTHAPALKIEKTRGYGAEVILEGTTSLERMARAEKEAAARGLTMVPPFDHPAIIAGQGTVGLELLEQYPEVTTVVVPAGGGGLLSGVSAAVKQMRSGVRVIGVEPEGAPKLSTSLAAGQPVTLERTASIADGLLPLRPGDVTFAHVQAFVDQVVTVPDDQIAAAVGWLFREARLVSEPSGAVTVAALLGDRIAVGERPLAIISGGNVAPEDYAKYLVETA